MQNKAQIIKIVTVSAIVFIVLLFAALTINLVKLSNANARERQLESELKRLETAYKNGEDEISTKQTRDYIIRYAREYLDMKGDGENAYTGKP